MATATRAVASQLLKLISDPRLLQAIVSLALGSMGNPNLSVGTDGTQVPVAGFANLLRELAAKVFNHAEAMAQPRSRLPEYLYQEGVLAVDPASPEQRATRLMEFLGETMNFPAPAGRAAFGAPEMTEDDEFYDELDAAEMLELMDEEGDGLEFDE